MPAFDEKLLTYLNKRRAAMEEERVSFDSHWRSLAEYIQPRRSRFFVTDRNKGNRRHNNIINSSGTQSLRTAISGLLAGVMSPTRPWFKLELENSELNEQFEVAVWLEQVEALIRQVFNQSNLYNMAPVMIGELLLFGTGCMLHVDDTDDVARFYAQTVGSYYLAQNDKYQIDTYMRKFQMQVAAMVDKFGKDACSQVVQDLYDRGDYDEWFDVVHMIEPRKERSKDNPFSINKPWRSIYYERGSSTSKYTSDRITMLQESGFDTFPLYTPRWGVAGEDIYGTDCPGMVVLGDVRQLQVQEKRKQQALDKLVNPPLKGPASLRNETISGLPGGITLFEGAGGEGDKGLAPLYEIAPQLNDMVLDIQKTERRIQDGFFLDLFLAITNIEGLQYKNELELAQRNEERLLQLGPVLEQLHGEFLDKLIDRTFNQLVAAKKLPPPPEEIQGAVLNVNYISSLAQAQRAVAAGSVERLTGFASSLAEIQPEVIDKIDFDQAVDEYNHAILGPPRMIRSEDQVQEIREQRAEQQQAQQQAEQQAQQAQLAQQAADTAKTGLEAAKTGGEALEG